MAGVAANLLIPDDVRKAGIDVATSAIKELIKTAVIKINAKGQATKLTGSDSISDLNSMMKEYGAGVCTLITLKFC